jgi:hypothetical protein|tara:strand:- start:69 stop:326 length:258 start_codon:yes stop_codon:yes gene_type:complete
MNREIKFIRHRLKQLDTFPKDFEKLKRFDLAEVLEDIILEIRGSLKQIEKQLEKQGKKVAMIKKKKVKKKIKKNLYMLKENLGVK